MSDQVTILQTNDGKLMTKQWRCVDGVWLKSDYDNAFRYDCTVADVSNIHELSELLTFLENKPTTCVIRAELRPGTSPDKVNRRKEEWDDIKPSFREKIRGRRWGMLDFDKVPSLPELDTNKARLEYLVSQLPEQFHNVSYHYQWSSSMGVGGWDYLSCHMWFWFDKPHRDSHMTARIQHEKWDIDDSVFRTVQPNFTARPVFNGCDDPIGNERSGFVNKEHDEVIMDRWIDPLPVAGGEMTGAGVGCGRGSSTFEEKLADIGPRYHTPIQRAICHYVWEHGMQTGSATLKQIMTDAIDAAPAGANPKTIYTNDNYLNKCIDSAIRNFGGTGGDARPKPMTRNEKLAAAMRRYKRK